MESLEFHWKEENVVLKDFCSFPSCEKTTDNIIFVFSLMFYMNGTTSENLIAYNHCAYHTATFKDFFYKHSDCTGYLVVMSPKEAIAWMVQCL